MPLDKTFYPQLSSSQPRCSKWVPGRNLFLEMHYKCATGLPGLSWGNNNTGSLSIFIGFPQFSAIRKTEEKKIMKFGKNTEFTEFHGKHNF